MLNKLFPKPVQFTIEGQELTFNTIADFEFCLSGRTSVPVKKIAELMKLPPHKLHKEASTIKEIEKKFVAILSRAIENFNSINQALRELDTNIFSLDHSWRQIFVACNNGGDELNPYRRVALVKYMQYVSSRQEIIKYLYSDKLSGAGTAASSAEANDEHADKLSGTVILDSQVSSSCREPMSNDFERLPKGEAMMIHLEQGRTADIMLSKHKCSLASRNGLFFIDQSGHRHALMKGKNVIGRDASSTVKIDSSLRDVSRLHLIIENKGDNILQLTDLSSHGTFVTPAVLSPQMA